MRRNHLPSLLLVTLVTTAAVAACGSDEDDSPGAVDPDGGALGDSGPGGGPDGPGDGAANDANRSDANAVDANAADAADAADPDAAVPDGPDLPPVAFPTTTPLLFGYTLADAFPGTFLSGAMDMDWPAGSNEPFVLQRGGHIVRLHGGGTRTLVLNFEGSVAARGEGGALGMALHPKFADAADPHPYVYVWYNFDGNPTRQRLSRFTWNPTTKVFVPGSQLVMVEQIEGATEHNGAHIRFGPDGFLYFANGDDTRSEVTTQRLNAGLFSGIFRIDVDSRGGAVSHAPPRQPTSATTQGYFIPNDNPFVGVAGANEEYFALGFRNPYSFNFDRANGALWLGDVGDSFREEINRVTAGSNYGWPFLEGTKQVRPGNPTIGTARLPTYEYLHASLGDLTAVSGGYVYRGAALPELAGKLLYSDWPTGRVWALDTVAATRTSLVESNWQNAPVGFGQDAAGEIYLIAWSRILKVVRAPAPHAVPKKLSETHLFRNLSTLKTSSSLVPYAIRSPLWSDGAVKERWAYVPPGTTATMTASGEVTLPVGSMLIKHFALPPAAQPVGGRTRNLETRVLVVGTDTTYGVTYRWNSQGTDADLVVEGVDETIADMTPAESRTWHFPSTGECWSCHRPENRVLAFRGEQLNFPLPGGAEQLASLAAQGVFDAASIGSSPAPLASPSDPAASIEDRASAYLAANCSPCHHPGASYLGGTTWNALPNVAPGSRGLVNAPHHNYPMASAFGLPNAPLVAPGNPNGSILMRRIKSTDPDLRMPALGRTKVDPVAETVLDAWITSLAP